MHYILHDYCTIIILYNLNNNTGQSGIPEGVVTRCYSTSDCSGPENDTLCQLFNRTIPGDVNYCCFEDQTTPRSDPGNLSFRLNGGTCTPCDGKIIILCTSLYLAKHDYKFIAI